MTAIFCNLKKNRHYDRIRKRGEDAMIEILNGIHETVAYDAFHGLKLYHNTQAENYPLHWHTALEIIMPQENGYTVTIDGTDHALEERDVWITAPGTLHALSAPPTGERLILLIDYSLLCAIKGMDRLLRSLQPYVLVARREHPELARTLCSYLDEISGEYDNPVMLTEASIFSLVTRFFVTFGRASFNVSERFPSTPSGKQHEYVETFMDVCNYITEHCTENLTVDELAAQAGFSKFHFARLFKQFANMSYHEYITQRRLEYAEKLLIQPGLPITEVSMRAGFGSLSTFNRIFKAAKGCTPSEYKNLNWKSHSGE